MEDYLEKISYIYLFSNERSTLGNPISSIIFEKLPINYTLNFEGLLFHLFKEKQYILDIKYTLENDSRVVSKDQIYFKLDLNTLPVASDGETASTKFNINSTFPIENKGLYKLEFALRDKMNNVLDEKSTFFEVIEEGDSNV